MVMDEKVSRQQLDEWKREGDKWLKQFKKRMDNGEHPRIFLAISAKEHINIDTAKALLNYNHHIEIHPIQAFTDIKIDSTHGIDASRNECMKAFLKSDCDYLMWIDSDVIVPPNFFELFKIHDPLVAPVCTVLKAMEYKDKSWKQPFPGIYDWDEEEDKIWLWPPLKVQNRIEEAKDEDRPPLVKADLIGGGCYLIRKDVAYKVRDEHGVWFKFTWTDVKGRARYGEDVYFFKMLQEHDLQYTVHLGVSFGHQKMVDLNAYAYLFYNQKNPIMPQEMIEDGTMKVAQEEIKKAKEIQARREAEQSKKNTDKNQS